MRFHLGSRPGLTRPWHLNQNGYGVGVLVGLFVCLVGWLVCLVGWLVGWLVCLFVVCCLFVCLLLLFLTRAERRTMCISTRCLIFIVQEPSTAKNSSPSRAPKNGAQIQTTWRRREKMPYFTAKNHQPPGRHTHHRRKTHDEILSRFPVRTCAWTSENTFT